MNYVPQILLDIYFLLHSFVTLFVVAVILWYFKPKLLPAISGWFIHLCLDIPFHESSLFATRFLFPLSSDIYVNGITWFNFEIMALNYLTLAGMYIYVLRREIKKQRMGESWKEDWVDKINQLGADLLKRKPLPSYHGKGTDIEGAPGEVPGEDK